MMRRTHIWEALAAVGRVFTVPNDNPELTLAQFKAFSKQVPLLYFILITNMVSLGWTHRNVAPLWLVVFVPAPLVLVSAARTVGWIFRRNGAVDAAMAYRRLRATNILAAPIALFCVGWSLALFPYGDAYQKAHVAFFMAITVIGIIFCLMHLRSAALIVTFLVNIPFFLFMVASGEATFVATGINVVLVTIAMIAVLLTHYRDFTQLNEQRLTLIAQQETLQATNSEMQALSDENLRLANLDSLTLLANRRSFFGTIQNVFETAQTRGGKFALGILDLDGFKPVNDTYGHAAGDKVLVEVARRLVNVADGRFACYRLGGDEFALIFDGADLTEATVLEMGKRVCDAIAERINIGSGYVQVTGSMGLAIYPHVGANGQDLYERADYALYTAKRENRAGVIVFNASQANALYRQREVEEVLLAADLEKELYLAYQPIVGPESGATVGFEALARWNSPVLGAVSPAEFIPLAEHNGRISFITRRLLELALKEARNWPAPLFLSFNLSPLDIATPENVLRIAAVVHASGFDPKRITFEITETAIMRDFEQAAKAVDFLRDLGAAIALDDFGTGYSSLLHVHKLPLSKIKIDASFVRSIDHLPASYKIVKSVLSLCQDMNLEAIAEGVETPQELETLKQLGVDAVQGYLLSRPIPASAIAEQISGRHRQEPQMSLALGL